MSITETREDVAALEMVARICHQANKVICEANGDTSQKNWEEAEQWQRDSAKNGVTFRVENPEAPESAQHDAWSADKVKEGWVYGEVKDPVAKTHPCLVPFDQLPPFQQLKDKLFCAIVDAVVASVAEEEVQEG